VPNKTIYVSDDDLPLYQRAQELVQGNLSAAITTALRRFVEVEEERRAGFKEITVKVGSPPNRKQRFFGELLGEWGRQSKSRVEMYKLFRTRNNKFAVHIERSPDWMWERSTGNGGWFERVTSYLGMGDQTWGHTAGEARLEVVETVDELREKIPPELFEMVKGALENPTVEDLDI